MSVFDPESTRNGFEAGFELADRPGDPYRFYMSFDVDGKYFEVEDMSMGDMVMFHRHLGKQIADAKRARRERAEKKEAA